MTSTAHSVFPVISIDWYDRKAKNSVKIDCPNVVKIYNQNMRGVKFFDMILAFYRLDHKSKKWYKSIFLWTINFVYEVDGLFANDSVY